MDRQSDSWSVRVDRRHILRLAGAGAIGTVGLATAQEEDADIVLEGDVMGWVGVEPDDIAEQTNPTLSLDEGETYLLAWENVDGLPHSFIIEDADGENLVETEIMEGQGATQTVEFEATADMAEYYCGPHPVSMRGQVAVDPAEDEPDVPDVDPEPEPYFEAGPTVGLETVAEGLTAPTAIAQPPDVDDHLFVTDQPGELWLIDDGERQDVPVLNLGDWTVNVGELPEDHEGPDDDVDERGLLGLAFHPDYADNGLVYLSYSAPPEDDMPAESSHLQIVSEFELPVNGEAEPATDEPLTGDLAAERRVMAVPSPQANNNGGPLAFDSEGYLYVAMGDGGGRNDAAAGHVDDWYDDNDGGNGQDTEANLLGGIHRIDVDAEPTESPRTDLDDEPDAGDGYAIPSDNPLVDREGHRGEYYAWGWRNPSGLAITDDDRILATDPGQEHVETGYEVVMGGNYSWNVKEGSRCFDTANPATPAEECPDATPDDVRDGEPLRDPVVEYPKTDEGEPVGSYIAGGHRYTGAAVPDLEGKWIVGDRSRTGEDADPDGRILTVTVPEEPTDEPHPEETWGIRELQFDDRDALDRFVHGMGRDGAGDSYVLVAEEAGPTGETGAVLQIVAPAE